MRIDENELINAPDNVKKFVKDIPENLIEYIEISDESLDLADKYLEDEVVGKTSKDDCIHIALATIVHASALVSWNFKHIVNLSRIRRYNSVNIKLGYSPIEIRSPLEMIDYEN